MLRSFPPSLQKKVKASVKNLIHLAEETGGPEKEKLHLAFTDAEDYPQFDQHRGANYEIGWLRGVAEALGVDVLSLVAQEYHR